MAWLQRLKCLYAGHCWHHVKITPLQVTMVYHPFTLAEEILREGHSPLVPTLDSEEMIAEQESYHAMLCTRCQHLHV
jgi:hypothetical protein